MSRLPDPSRYLVGGEPPDVLLPARVVALLHRLSLDELRLTVRGKLADPVYDEALMAVHIAALKYREHVATSNSGNLEVPSLDDVQVSEREQIGCVEAGKRLGLSRRHVINLAPELCGEMVANAWLFDAEAVADLQHRRMINKESTA